MKKLLYFSVVTYLTWLNHFTEVEIVKQFTGEGFLMFSPQLQTIKLPWFNSLSFRTREQFGLLMLTGVGQTSNSIIEVSESEKFSRFILCKIHFTVFSLLYLKIAVNQNQNHSELTFLP